MGVAPVALPWAESPRRDHRTGIIRCPAPVHDSAVRGARRRNSTVAQTHSKDEVQGGSLGETLEQERKSIEFGRLDCLKKQQLQTASAENPAQRPDLKGVQAGGPTFGI